MHCKSPKSTLAIGWLLFSFFFCLVCFFIFTFSLQPQQTHTQVISLEDNLFYQTRRNLFFFVALKSYKNLLHSLSSGLVMLDGFVYAVGGWEGRSRLDSVECYNPHTNTWQFTESFKMAVTSPAVVALDGLLYVTGKKCRLHTCIFFFRVVPFY